MLHKCNTYSQLHLQMLNISQFDKINTHNEDYDIISQHLFLKS